MNPDDMDWPSITSIGPFIDQLSGILSTGVQNGTVYDVLTTNMGTGNATVNATVIDTRCALLTGVTYNKEANLLQILSNGELMNTDVGIIPWKDQMIWRILKYL
ncbi:hypothetical protein BJ138DRAFT_1114900 [Hygrophoropsis aurantiaca]|uniref:Uncharacterized protein n=1 Tax=Hygrophoropsis aurantiaca TaxID=72124 RepID=A0ACB8A8G5_9AGAM|nr:hypothetical protein BJ138DRAFT_1114900 [Hygrophoropsis aurantiaca]